LGVPDRVAAMAGVCPFLTVGSWCSTGFGVGYNLAVMGFGGFAQFFVTWPISSPGSATAPVLYVISGTEIGPLAAFFLVDGVRDCSCRRSILRR
jgi:hypothetical protein